MSLGEIVFTILIGPLKFIFEMIYMKSYEFLQNPGLAIVVLSLCMNFLVLPLYRKADSMQETERLTENKLRAGIAHIKKTFHGDERMMILQTYYRQNNYSPLYVLKGSVSLFLEIPFFIAAYQFLSHLDLLNGASFLFISDLGAPDGLISVGKVTINVLPFVMTGVNLVSCFLFTKEQPLKTKIQLYVMALFFLVFLYKSPAGLVFYWTLNNLFSLVKTIFYKIKDAKIILYYIFAVLGCLTMFVSVYYRNRVDIILAACVFIIGIALELPLILHLIQKKKQLHFKFNYLQRCSDRKLLIWSEIYLIILVGVLIPVTLLNSSAKEFVDVYYYYNPIWFVVSSCCYAVGLCGIWLNIFYGLVGPKVQKIIEVVSLFICGIVTVDFFIFGTDKGNNLSYTLMFEKGVYFNRSRQLGNIAVIVAVVVILALALRFLNKKVVYGIAALSVAVLIMSVVNISGVIKDVSEIKESCENVRSNTPGFKMSKNGQNVVVIMLDRAMGEYIPYIMEEKPELKDSFSGFTYYANTLSYGLATNFATPSLFGGYEYTPERLNARSDEKLVDKHNEALKVMPTLFTEEGYDVTFFEPVYANYQIPPDVSIFDGMENVDAYLVNGYFVDEDIKKQVLSRNRRNFFVYSCMKAAPLSIQPTIYDKGRYNSGVADALSDVSQVAADMHTATGKNEVFMKSYNVLKNMDKFVEVEEDGNNLLLMTNDITHEEMLLKEPEYTPESVVDNTEFDALNEGRFTLGDESIVMENTTQMSHYQINMAAMIQLANWFDYLKVEGLYDNTRIILVSDHGRDLYHKPDEVIDKDGTTFNFESFEPLLMVKDFDAKEFTVSEELMTNADVPTLAMSGVLSNTINPFTGNEITDMGDENKKELHIFTSYKHLVQENNGNVFLPDIWLTYKDGMWY